MKLQPVIPFEPVKTDHAPEGDRWIAQIKWDGVRMLAYLDEDSEVRLVNRRLNDKTAQYPELLDVRSYCEASSVILDGEVIALDDGKPSFHRVMSRDRMRRTQGIPEAMKRIPVVYMIFDILYLNGEWITQLPLWQRQQHLEQIIRPNASVQLVPSVTEYEQLFAITGQHGLEGVVYKDLDSSYSIDGKDARWQKHKHYHDLFAIVGGVTKRGGIVNALLLGLYHQGQLLYIGHAGTGKLKAADWRLMTDRLEPFILEQKPFANTPERLNNTVWLKPVLTVSIRYMEWTKDGVLRQPSIQGFVQVDPEACSFSQL
ncbi:ATP-dependent DNA ligase [Paenibacillus senegalensis]|uniref:ATP-dependent DNA ligase n=1 Tax=Paenibacillus senegalensis TaxID=1465766 RepID=UPI0002896888|nr:RNA ligase family protein [Paenibacillus senegalensis]